MTVTNLHNRGGTFLKQMNEQEQKLSQVIFQKKQTPPSTGLGFLVYWQGGLLARDEEQFSRPTGQRQQPALRLWGPPYQRQPHHTAK